METTAILPRLQGVKKSGNGWTAKCPAHDDGTASLSITQGDDGRTLLKCHAGCSAGSVCSAVNLTLADLFPTNEPRNGVGKHIVASYDYHDASGKIVFQVVRFEPKDFRQRKPDAIALDGWTWNTKGVEKVLFRLPEILRDVQTGKFIFLCEGEKDVLKMVELGLSATCNPGGAGKWQDSFSESLRGADCVIIADKDKAGRDHAQLVASKLHGGAKSVLVIELPDVNGATVKDAHDYFVAGGKFENLIALVDSAPTWTPAIKIETGGTSEPTADVHPPDATNHFKSDVGYGDAFVQRHAKSIRFCADEKIWLVFDDVTGWRRDETGTAIKSLAADYARELYQAALIEAAAKEPEIGKRIISNAAALGNKKRIDPAMSFAACNPAVVVRAEQLDADPFLVGVQNGVVNLADGTFQAHRREHLVSRRLAVSFDVNATAPTWEKFLADVQPESEMRDFLQRLCGYWLTGEIREHVLPFHFGTGANGKGTFLEHGVLKLAADYGAKLTDSLVYASDNGRLPHLELANLCGKRFALGEENSESGKLNEALLKSMTGGDRQKGRFHYGNFVEYAPTYKIALVGNHRPRIDGTDDGIWRRFLLVDWKIQIPEAQRDTTLKDKLAAEMSGILNWCIAGARAWLAGGLNPPASCKAATAAFRDKSDSLAEFISENFIADAESYCTKADVFAAYQHWAEQQGIKYPMSKRALGVQLINRGWQEFKQGHENSKCWLGYRLQP